MPTTTEEAGRGPARAPTGGADYQSYIIADTYGYGQSVIQDLDTYYLPYYHGVSLAHYNVLRLVHGQQHRRHR